MDTRRWIPVTGEMDDLIATCRVDEPGFGGVRIGEQIGCEYRFAISLASRDASGNRASPSTPTCGSPRTRARVRPSTATARCAMDRSMMVRLGEVASA